MTNSVVTKNYNILVAKQMKESVSEDADTKIYCCFGRVSAWDDEDNPDQANTSYVSQNDMWNAMVGGKRVFENDIEHVIARKNWTSGVVYNQYDDRDVDLFSRDFYVLTTDYRVYKCLSNNSNTLSTIEPTSEIVNNTTQTSDGYIWKFMYSLNSEDKYRFTNSEYFPVKELTTDNGSLQWDIQEAAVDGKINSIFIEDSGNYTTDNLTITITGDGSGANAYATVNVSSNVVSNVTIDNTGSGYTYATATITGGGGTGGGSLYVPIPPSGGHGSDALRELGGSNLMVNIAIRGTESGTLPIVNNFRRIALMAEPYAYGTSNVYTNTTFTSTTDLTLTGVSSNFTEDEIVYQGSSLEGSTFKGTVVEWNSANSNLKLNNTEGTTLSSVLVGDTSGSVAFVASVETPDIANKTGQVLYIDNIEEIKRNEFQTENFRIVLKY